MNLLARSLVAATLGASMATAASAQTTEINFGIISTESQVNLAPIWEPFLEAMAEAVGLPINPFFASDYAGIVEGMRFGQVQIAWYGNASAIQAVDRANGEVFAQSVSVEGNPGYWSVLIVPIDSPLQTLDDALVCDGSLDFGLGDPNSTSGYLVPMTFVFAQRGIRPADCFSTVTNSNHESNALAVANGQVDIATNNTENMDRLLVTNPQAHAKIRVLWQSPLIPSDPIVWNKDLEDEVKNALLRFFMSYGRVGTPEEIAAAREILAALGWAPFRPSSDAQLYPIRIMDFTRAVFTAEADATLSDAARASTIAELEGQRDAIQALLDTIPPL
ncbi:MAG: phosphonate ABC transporter substrate-binding protein [Bauldia sp.]|nr:phosphonate ABC transporter substrate-binding protein [Bauldia sp.]